jgi:WD40 repeat protein
LVSVDVARLTAAHRFLSNTPSAGVPFTLELDAMLPARRRVGVPFSAEIEANASCFAISSDGKAIFSCGHWDNTFKCTWLDNSRPAQSIGKHKDLVTVLAITADGKVLVTGSKDTTLLVWEVVCIKGTTYRLEENPMHILYGHNDDVCRACDREKVQWNCVRQW